MTRPTLKGVVVFDAPGTEFLFFLFLFLTESFILTEVSFHVDRMAPSFDDDDEVFEEFRNETNPFLMEGRFRV